MTSLYDRLRSAIATLTDEELGRAFPDPERLDRLQEMEWEVRAAELEQMRWEQGVGA